jgi:hypothetical protein
MGSYYLSTVCKSESPTPTPTPPCQVKPLWCGWFSGIFCPEEPPGGWCPDVTPTPTEIPGVSPTPEDSSTPSPSAGVNPTSIQTTAVPTVTVEESQTKLALSLAIPGIGSNIDKGQNNNPEHPQRKVEIKIFNSQNQEALAQDAIVIYNSTPSTFEGTLALSSSIPSGFYTIKVRTNGTLWKAYPGIQSIIQGSTNALPRLALTSGDVNQDNEINLLDYNLVLSCIRDKDTCPALVTLQADDLNLAAGNLKNFISLLDPRERRGD